jgi:hypothetical protein
MKRYAAVIILIFLLPNLYSLIVGHESFPFTPAPMFTQYVPKKAQFYDFNFVGQNESGEVKLKPKHKHNTSPISYNRFFFDQIYGSALPNYPVGTVKNDTKKRFEERLSKFFQLYFDYPEAKLHKQIKLVVNAYDNNYKLTDSHVVGIYEPESNHFTHTWGTQK